VTVGGVNPGEAQTGGAGIQWISPVLYMQDMSPYSWCKDEAGSGQSLGLGPFRTLQFFGG
jgi:hypothetical protein